MPSKWENVAHNGLICFFQHNYIPNFEQWLCDRVCVISTWFGDICCSRRDFCTFYKRSWSLFSNSIRCNFLRQDQCNVACRNTLAIGRRHSARRQRIAPFDLRRASLPVSAAISHNVSSYFVFKEVVRYAAHRVWYSFASKLYGFPHWQTFGWLQYRHARCT